jgi:hypothetical protein
VPKRAWKSSMRSISLFHTSLDPITPSTIFPR